jgi:hypothetical protein
MRYVQKRRNCFLITFISLLLSLLSCISILIDYDTSTKQLWNANRHITLNVVTPSEKPTTIIYNAITVSTLSSTLAPTILPSKNNLFYNLLNLTLSPKWPRNIRNGKWVYKAEKFPNEIPVCCSWDDVSTDPHCGTVSNPHDYLGISLQNKYMPTGGNACVGFSNITKDVIMHYQWYEGLVEEDWNATEFCRILDKRQVRFIGDSTSQQFISALYNYVLSGNGSCAHNLDFTHSDTLDGKLYSEWNRGPTWLDISLRPNLGIIPDIIIIGAGPHIRGLENYKNLLSSIKRDYLSENFTSISRPQLIWRTSGGAGCTLPGYRVESRNAMEDRIEYWNKYKRVNPTSTYNYPEIVQFDEIAVDFWKGTGAILDLRPLWLRSDARPGSVSLDRVIRNDCGHLLQPGAFRFAVSRLMNLLKNDPLLVVSK